jgi:hypothetical protein
MFFLQRTDKMSSPLLVVLAVLVTACLPNVVHGRFQMAHTFQAWAYNPDTAASNPAQFPEHPLPSTKDDVGLALSGGGSRAMMASRGVLQGLRKLGLLSKIKYMSTVSGGTWAGSLFSFKPPKMDIAGVFGCKRSSDNWNFCDRNTVNYQTITDDQLLDVYTEPQLLLLAKLQALPAGSMANAVLDLGLETSVYGLIEYVLQYNAAPTSNYWNFLVDRYLLTPGVLGTHHKSSTFSPVHHLGNNNFRPYAWNASNIQVIKNKGNNLQQNIEVPSQYALDNRFDVLTDTAGTTDSARPFIIMNSAIISDGGVPVADQCRVEGGTLVPFECTALYCGVPSCPKGSCKLFGGGWASTFGARLKMNFKDSSGGTDSFFCPACDADQDWLFRLFNDNSPALDSAGGYTSAYTRLRSPTNGGFDHKVVLTDRQVSQMSLKDIVGPSSAAPSQALCILYSKLPSVKVQVPNLVPSFHYVSASKLLDPSIPGPSVVSQRLVVVDGGSLENTGITALLRRRLPKIISLVSSTYAMKIPAGSTDLHATIDSQVSNLWGYSYDTSMKRWVANNTKVWVFDQGPNGAKFFEMIDGLWKAQLTGAPVFYQTNVVVRPNVLLGISGPDVVARTYKVHITWVYNQLNQEWYNRLSPDVKKALASASADWFLDFETNLRKVINQLIAFCTSIGSACPPFVSSFLADLKSKVEEIIAWARAGVSTTEFPYYNSFLELGLKPIQSNSLTQMHSHNIVSREGMFRVHFPSEATVSPSVSTTVCLKVCPPKCTAAINCACVQNCNVTTTTPTIPPTTVSSFGFAAVITHRCTALDCCAKVYNTALCSGLTMTSCSCFLGTAQITCPTVCQP